MAYYDSFRTRMNSKGKTVKDRKLINASRSFNNWFSVTKEIVDIDGASDYAVFQDHSQGNNKDLSDDKFVITENSSKMEVGSLINWRDKMWIVFTDEVKTIPTHKQAKVKESNYCLRWITNSNVICNNGNGYYGYVQNQTLYTLGVSTSGSNIWLVNAKMTMYLPYNEESFGIRIGQRIMIGSQVYKIMFRDAVSRQGLVHFLMEQDVINDKVDNVELGIAEYYRVYSDEPIIDEDDIETPTNKEVVIKGEDYVKIGSNVSFNVDILDNGVSIDDDIVEWTISDISYVTTINEQTTDSIAIHIESNFSKVGSSFTIIARTADDTIGYKTVNVISPY